VGARVEVQGVGEVAPGDGRRGGLVDVLAPPAGADTIKVVRSISRIVFTMRLDRAVYPAPSLWALGSFAIS
jgi:hypothetical protein